jgi:hypothetical protein
MASNNNLGLDLEKWELQRRGGERIEQKTREDAGLFFGQESRREKAI